VVSFTRRPLYLQRKCPWYPVDRRLDGPQSRSGHGGEKEIPGPARTQTFHHPAHSPQPSRNLCELRIRKGYMRAKMKFIHLQYYVNIRVKVQVKVKLSLSRFK
jgi:hypothetical protein